MLSLDHNWRLDWGFLEKLFSMWDFRNFHDLVICQESSWVVWNKSNHCHRFYIFAIIQRWKTIEHWINIQVSNSVIKWEMCSHENSSGMADSEDFLIFTVKIAKRCYRKLLVYLTLNSNHFQFIVRAFCSRLCYI